MYHMLPYPPYHLGWIIDERTDKYYKNGKPRKNPKKYYYGTIFLPNGFSKVTGYFTSWDKCNKYCKREFHNN